MKVLDSLEKNFSEVLRGAAAAFVVRLIGAALVFIFNILLARKLGADATGLFVLALMIVSVASVVSRIGLDNTMLKMIATSASSREWGMVAGVFFQGLLLATLLSTALTLVLYVSSPWVTETIFDKPRLLPVLQWMLPIIVPMALIALVGESLKGIKQVAASALVQAVIVPASSIAGLYLLVELYAIEGAVWGYLAASVIAMVVGLLLWKLLVPYAKRTQVEYRLIFASCLPLFWVASMNLVTMWMSTGMLGVFGTSADVAIYNAAARTAMLVSFVLYAFNSIAAPKFAEMYHQQDIGGLERTARFSARMTTLFAAPVLLLFIIFSSQVMALFGDEFRAGAAALVILSLGQFVNVMTGSVGYLLIMTGHERSMRNNVLLSGAVNVLLNFMLTPSLGWMGAAIATAGAMVVANLAATWLVYRYLGLKVLPWLSLRASRPKGSV